jgi:hypothetical protein
MKVWLLLLASIPNLLMIKYILCCSRVECDCIVLLQMIQIIIIHALQASKIDTSKNKYYKLKTSQYDCYKTINKLKKKKKKKSVLDQTNLQNTLILWNHGDPRYLS